MEDIVMKILERKKVELQFVDVKVSLKVDFAALSTDILFDTLADADKVYDILNNQESFNGCYNMVEKITSKTIRVTGEIFVKYLHTNTLVVEVYKDWRTL